MYACSVSNGTVQKRLTQRLERLKSDPIGRAQLCTSVDRILDERKQLHKQFQRSRTTGNITLPSLSPSANHHSTQLSSTNEIAPLVWMFFSFHQRIINRTLRIFRKCNWTLLMKSICRDLTNFAHSRNLIIKSCRRNGKMFK